MKRSRILIALSALALGTGAALAQAWQHQEIGQGTKPALAVTSAGQPQILYMLERVSGWVRMATLEGGSWTIDTVSEGYFYGPPDLTVGQDGAPQGTFHDHQDGSFNPRLGDATHVTRLADGRWSSRAINDVGHDGWDARITVDSDGLAHLSAIDPLEFGGQGIDYYRQLPDGSWEVESIGSGPLTYKYATSISVAPDGTPHITYYDQAQKALTLATPGDGGWTLESVDGEGDSGLFSYVVVDELGGVHISYLERTGPSAGIVKYAFRPAGDGWRIESLGNLDALFFGFTGARNITSLDLDSEGRPWIAFSDEAVLNVAVRQDGAWQVETVVESDPATNPLGQIVSLKLDGADRPHLAYTFVTNKQELDGVLWYATRP